jgi:hypothetical protein
MAGARIRVRRDDAPWPDRLRGYRVVLDGAVVGSVKRGESITVMTDAGYHELHLKIDWARSESVQLDLKPDGEADVRCWPNARALTALYWITVGRSRYIGVAVSPYRAQSDATP